MNSDLMDVKEAAAIIGVTVGRVRQLASAGKLKGERLGGPERGLWVFQRADVVAYAARPRRPPHHPAHRRKLAGSDDWGDERVAHPRPDHLPVGDAAQLGASGCAAGAEFE